MSSQLRGNFTVMLEGRGNLVIRPGDHVATGGEGSIYRAKDTVVKLYLDADKMQRDGLVDKIKKLSTIKHPYIVSPTNLVTDKGKPIGYYMPFVNGEPLSRIFTNDFRTHNKFTDAHGSVLVNGMREAVMAGHSAGALLIDPNELNWMAILGAKPEPRVIDVDSWVIGPMPPKVALMPSIRDWHSKGFSQLTDWFSWGIVSFQVYSGIHPYKGTLAGYKMVDVEKRMKDNASVFAPGVRLNQNVRDFSKIPPKLLDWYLETFQNGLRSIPPSPFDTAVGTKPSVVVTRTVVTTAGDILTYEKLFSPAQKNGAIKVFSCGIVLFQSGDLVELRNLRTIGKAVSADCELVAVDGGWLLGQEVLGKLNFCHISSANLTETPLSLPVNALRILRFENRIFVVTEQGLTELALNNLNSLVLSVSQTWNVLVNSTKWFDNLGVEDAMGAMYLVLPFGEKSCVPIRVKELDGLRAVSAKCGNRFAAVVAVDRKGDYKKLELVFNREYSGYQATVSTVDNAELNLACLPKGVCSEIVDDGELIVFVPTTGVIKKLPDRQIDTAMQLANWDDQVVYVKGGQVFRVKMK